MSDFRSPLFNARNHGAAGSGTGAFLWERLTALALIPLGVVLLCKILGATSGGLTLLQAQQWVASPVNGGLIILFFTIAMINTYLCARVVVEDYLHVPSIKFAALLGLTAATVIGGLVVFIATLYTMFI